MKAFDFTLKLGIASLHVSLRECNSEFAAPHSGYYPALGLENNLQRGTPADALAFTPEQVFRGFSPTRHSTGILVTLQNHLA